ncbi:MAG: DUF2851 family protein [Rhizobacter sp.]|nr:DUF2851 family protein [Chlorobiales bacterium]
MAIPEKFVRHIWKNLYLDLPKLSTADGRTLSILSVGTLNRNEGADFHRAKVVIDGELKEGDVEIHSRSSDWQRHKHSGNPHYDSVILHAVFDHDEKSPGAMNAPNHIPVLEMQRQLNGEAHTVIAQCIRDESALASRKVLHCSPQIESIGDAEKLKWLDELAMLRFENKVHRFAAHLTGETYNQVITRSFARSLGYSENAEAMEQLVSLTPLTRLESSPEFLRLETFAARRTMLEAVLFALSGLIPPEDSEDGETQMYLQSLKAVVPPWVSTLSAMPQTAWVFFRLRPSNFPTLRVAALAEVLTKQTSPQTAQGFLESALEIISMPVSDRRKILLMENLFMADASGYWQTHYRFGAIAKKPIGNLVGKNRAAEIVINALLPVLKFYADQTSNTPLAAAVMRLYSVYPKGLTSEAARQVLDELLGEGYTVKSASMEQALLELKKKYCDPFRCLDCRMGKIIFGFA